jgi:hypothetical protein
MRGHNEMACVYHFFKSLGWRFSLDDEEETLRVQFPEDTTIDDVAETLAQEFYEPLVEVVKEEARLERRQLVGGPHNGEPHLGSVGQRIGIRERRGCYSVYMVSEDGRAFFQGWASSRCAIGEGKLTKRPET